jgi:hypothetical protein
MRWHEITDKTWHPREPRYRSEYFVKTVDLSDFGPTWGKSTAGFLLSFSIYKRKGNSSHTEELPYTLLINDGRGNGHIYLQTVEEGKEIAEKILEKLANNFEATEHPYGQVPANQD